jgi:hypothetical protein
LWLQGELFPSYREYNFGDYRRSLERGLGNCGVAASTLVGLLQHAGVKSAILGLKGHTLAWAKTDTSEYILDPDYGVIFKGSYEEYAREPELSMRYGEAFERLKMPEEYRVDNLRLVKSAIAARPPFLSSLDEFLVDRDSEDQYYRLKWLIPLCMIAPWILVKLLLGVGLVRPASLAPPSTTT